MPIDHLGFQIRTLSNLISRKINQMVSDEEETLTAHQSWVLDYLTKNHNQDIFQKDIEKKFSIRRSTASHMLQLMEKKRLHSAHFLARWCPNEKADYHRKRNRSTKTYERSSLPVWGNFSVRPFIRRSSISQAASL